MKLILRKLFRPITNLFEKGDDIYSYQPSHHKILITVTCLFFGLATAIVFLAKEQKPAYYLSTVMFEAVGLITLIMVDSRGNEKAVATICGSR